VRAYHSGWFKDVLTELPRVEKGYIYPLTGPGLGTRLLPGQLDREGVQIRRSALA
jgi:L-alanine-DL-glutamate epimerase-like enolase superfamily enzyme